MRSISTVYRSNFNIVLFVSIIVILNGLFYLYVGAVTPGGRTYLPFLEKYFNLPVWTANGLARTSAWLLKVFRFNTYQKNLKNISIVGGGGVNITWACIGFGVISCWLAFVVAHKAGFRFKLKWLILGIAFVFLLNIVRLMLIPVAIHYKWRVITSLDVHTSFNIACYILLIAVSVVFVKKYKQHEPAMINQDK